MRTFVRVFVFLALLIAQTVAAQDIVPGKLVPKVTAKDGFSYALYLPSVYNAKQQWPMIFLLDPAARGTAAAERFIPAAEKYGYIVAASNDSRNGPLRIDAISAMFNDVHSRFAVDRRRVYLGGMSGGGRAAVLVAEACKSCVAGVLLCASSVPEGRSVTNKSLMVYGIVGETDYLYPSLMSDVDAFTSAKMANRFESWSGGHGWAPAEQMDGALAWFRLQEMARGTTPRDERFIHDFATSERQRADALASAGEQYRAFRLLRQLATDMAPFIDVSELKKQVDSLANTREVKDGIRDDKRAREAQDAYATPLLKGVAEIANGDAEGARRSQVLQATEELALRANREKDRARLLAIRRALANVVVNAAESAQSARQRKDNVSAAALYEIAAAAQPSNANMLYNAACSYALAGDKKRAIRTLQQAVARGFNDVATMRSDSDLVSLRDEADFQKIVGAQSH